MTDYFVALAPLEPRERLDKIFSLAAHSVVEIETHPTELDEYKFLTSGDILVELRGVTIAPAYEVLGALRSEGASVATLL
jgi:hypothetical protein